MTTPSPANDFNADSEGSDATILNNVEAEDIDLAGRRNSSLSNASYESDRRPPSQPASDFEQSARHSFASVSDDRRSVGGSEPAGGRVSACESSSQHGQDDDVFSDHSPRSSTCSNAEADHLKQPQAPSRRLTGGSRISDMQPYDPDEEFIPAVRETPRPPFRSPSSVKAMQMNSPPPSVSGSSRSNRRATRSSISRIGSPAVTTQFSPKKTPPRFKRNTPPLVLLHVTLLPLRWPWGHLMDNARPSELSDACKNLREAWKQLQARVGDTICDRGILLPHPQNDFEILEERLLEALELPLRRRARILECGHYLGPANEMATPDDEIGSDDEDFEQGATEAEDRHWCSTCQSDIRYDSLGEGKMFRTKVYASNGLMKAGAWDACWKEMERVDVELEPIIDPSIVDELERIAATQEREAIEAEIAASTHMELNGPDDAFDAPPAHEDERELYEERMREIYGQPESHEAVPEEVITEMPIDREDSAQPWSIASVMDVRSGPWADVFKYGPRDVVQLLVFILCVLLLQYLGIGFDRSSKVEPRKSENSLPVPAMPPQESPGTEIAAREPTHGQPTTAMPHPMEESYAACTSALEAAHASLAVPVAALTVTVTETVSVPAAETAQVAEVEPRVDEQLMPETQEEHTMLEKQEEHTMLEAQDEQTMFEGLAEHTAEAPMKSAIPAENTMHEDEEEDTNEHGDLSSDATGKTEL
ncbi:pathway-specific nitrogen regulator [Cordyceps fumosorosea ARSEF 2679]|uniref:Pathway-specific nitrogen regulator n=1 Tax=Cordyceps fumosorosea (strain ARSEF 2679) TaxID=1081104 RepID=A0A168B9M6_CORFA|nr:pathway-specific nitrogen regulator [Cordyceps fumosorosea ARSEF 2679]OAA69815.1 pathway-specific nitrogen regulator [Cordyceps fumosorosea ARSEF 2679]